MRAIDADVIISQCEEYSNLLKYDGTTDREWALVKRMILMINEQPTIEPQRKNGMWIDNHTTCSECGWKMIDDVIESPNIVAFNFCPNCGAEMSTEDKE